MRNFFNILKKTVCNFIVIVFTFSTFDCNMTVLGKDTGDVVVSADSAILICADSGHVIFSKNSDKEHPMASTTKIMTALLTLEHAGSNNKEVRIDDTMLPVEGSSMYLKVGNVITLESLAKGMLSVSGNDAANSAAIAIGGSVEQFVDMMNQKAMQIGMDHTHFVTPSGLDKKDHHSTAYDMAILGAYAMDNKMFYEIASKKLVRVPFLEPKETRILRNGNRLLREYEGCIGVKTGFTSLAGRCLVSCAERNGVRLIAVTLKAPDDWNDHKNMFNYGFNKVESIELGCDDIYSVDLVGGETCSIKVSSKNLVKACVPKEEICNLKRKIQLPKFQYAPVREGEIVGKSVYFLGNERIASVDLCSKEQQEVKIIKRSFFRKVLDFFKWGS